MAVPITRQPNPYIVGRPITEPERFFGREDIFQFINDALHSGVRVILLYGQRRIGKSSVLYHIPHFLDQEDVHYVQFDLQGKAALSLAEVLYDLAEAIAHSLEADAKAVAMPEDVTTFEKEPGDFRNRFLPAVYDVIGDKRLLLLLDEFDVLSDPAENTAAATFFPYLQGLLQAEKRLTIIPVVGRRLEELPTLLNLFRESLNRKISLLAPEAARGLIVKTAAEQLDFDEGAIAATLDLTAGHPYFIQLMGYEVFRYLREQGRKDVTAEDVRAVTDTAIVSGIGGLAWFREGLPIAERVILSAVAEVAGEWRYATQENIHAILEENGIQFSSTELTRMLDRLVDWELLKSVKGRGYQVTIELVRHWVVKEHPLRRAMQELEFRYERATDAYEKARAAHQVNELSQAIELYREALSINPNHFSARLGLAEAEQQQKLSTLHRELEKTDSPAQIVEISRQILELEPDDEDAQIAYDEAQRQLDITKYRKEAKAAFREGAYEKAITAWEKLLTLADIVEKAAKTELAAVKKQQQVRDESARAISAAKRGDYQTALDAWKRVLAVEPDHAKAQEGVKEAQHQLEIQAHRQYREFEPARNIDDVWNAVDGLPLAPGDPRYVDFSKVRGTNTLRQIERMIRSYSRVGRDLHLLFTGYRGTGKTTELHQLQSRIQQDYKVLYFDAARELDVNNLALTDLLLAIAKETIEGMRQAGYHLPDRLLEDVGEWFFEKALERPIEIATEVGAKAEIGIPRWVSLIIEKTFSTIRLSTGDREIIRRKLEGNRAELIDRVNHLLIAAREQVRGKNKENLLFIIEGLDKLSLESGKNLFLANGARLKELKGNFLFFVPISLLYDEQATLLPFDQRVILPMIPIYKRGMERNLNEPSISRLTELISKRMVLEEIFTHPEETVRELILASGGNLRDLMRLIRDAWAQTEDKIIPAHAKAAINMLMRDYERVVRDEEYTHLITTYLTQAPPNNAINQKLIYQNVILVYQDSDGAEWKDVHPAVVRNLKFQRALSERI